MTTKGTETTMTTTTGNGGDLLTCREAAALIGVRRETISRWVKSGELEGLRLGNTYAIRRDAILLADARRRMAKDGRKRRWVKN